MSDLNETGVADDTDIEASIGWATLPWADEELRQHFKFARATTIRIIHRLKLAELENARVRKAFRKIRDDSHGWQAECLDELLREVFGDDWHEHAKPTTPPTKEAPNEG